MNKYLLLIVCFTFTLTQYSVIYEPERMLFPPEKDHIPNAEVPKYVLTKFIERKKNLETILDDLKTKDNGDSRPLWMRVDLDEFYLNSWAATFMTVCGYLTLLVLEVALIGHYFIYPIYQDRIKNETFVEQDEQTSNETKRRKQHNPTRRRKKL